MDKKAFTPLQKIISIIILLVFLAVFTFAFFAPKGFLNQVADRAEIFKTMIPGKDIDSKTELVVSDEIKEVTFSYCEQFRKFLENNYEDERCLLKMPLLPDLEGHKIEILNTENGLYLKLINVKDQTIATCSVDNLDITSYSEKNISSNLTNISDVNSNSSSNITPELTTKKIKLCAVVGEPVAKNFYNNYLDDFKDIKNIQPDYIDITKARIDYGSSDYGDHSITISTSDSRSLVHELETNKDTLGSVNILYKPDKDHICYIPTEDGNWACDGDGGILDDDCLTDEDEYIFRSLSECGQNSFLDLIDIMGQTKDEKSDCLRYYPVQHEIQKNPTKDFIRLSQNEDNIIVSLYSEGILKTQKTLQGNYLCTISGKTEEPAEAFFKFFFKKDEAYKSKSRFSYVKKIDIYYGREDNDYYDLDVIYEDGTAAKGLELHDSNLIYQPHPNHICFMPSNDYINFADTGMDDDWIAYLTNKKSREEYNLPLCSEK